MDLDLDKLTVAQIRMYIEHGILTEQEVIEYYNNEWWDETP